MNTCPAVQDNRLQSHLSVTPVSHTCPVPPPGLLSAVDLVEVNPLRGQSEDAVESTVGTALDLLLACFGRLRAGNHPPDYVLPEP